MISRVRAFFIATALVAITSLPAGAGDVILTLDGAIAGGVAVDLTREDLEAVGSATIKTRTPWHDRKVTFEGVPLQVLLEKFGATGDTLSVVALNNYRSEMPVGDISKYGVILAMKQDGAYMPISDKGPLFIVYPFDSDEALDNEVYYARSAWQVRSITVE
ncbi:MAG: oxidoreductase [Hoeflea sp.]|uniref:oxidoreductase n=1 Tax=Hoeflea sp. TaxID=1940281 RepID=UPI001D9D1161|nr:oxidoreductase [Hoeflea sp.]MBU4530132.1 oxidoreductase [Alphaproteobacteria bacterium]MBU4542583.1 oxidoreductase [Alphaproteobacteria bacterium]MBU4551264.1 oxidoreductase [Alphaproteobacteria bacterium]MBV1723087.1 oxidoreductase [Hoeflea sp.]MBV1760098.1 oxidoreductase [Hoeflea sp.]